MVWFYSLFAFVLVLWIAKCVLGIAFGTPTFWCEMYDVDFNFSSDESSKEDTSSGE